MRARKVLLVAALLVLCAAGAGALWTWHPMGVLAQALPAAAPAPKPVSVAVAQITTNTADGHYAQIALSVRLAGTRAAQRFAGRKAAIQDAIIGTLRSRTSAQLNGDRGMQNLGSALERAMDAVLGGHEVLHIYFTSFVVQ